MNNKKVSDGSQRQAKRKENHSKKQATPSQLRANHEKQKQQQKENAKLPGQSKVTTSSKKSVEKQLDAKVRSLHEQSDRSLEAYSLKAKQMKDQITAALEKPSNLHKTEPLKDVANLRDTILELSGVVAKADDDKLQSISAEQQVKYDPPQPEVSNLLKGSLATEESVTTTLADENSSEFDAPAPSSSSGDGENVAQSDTAVTNAALSQPQNLVEAIPDTKTAGDGFQQVELSSNCFEPLMARLDPKTKYVALKSSLERHFVDAPQLLDPICKKLIYLTGQIDALMLCKEQQQIEIQKLTTIKDKLSDLCRELQKSNNQIRIESLQMIKDEQNKAKGQASKIQSTLSDVMKLFDESQQRTLNFKQENIELRGELKNLLQHCDNWEKCVETTLKQREIENRLAKAELARMSLIRNEEKEKFFKEKSELLKALTMMKEQQSKIEDKEAKLRSDLTNYASKYDECQEIIHAGLSKFQVESKRMLRQIEQGRRDNIQLLNKYEASNKKIKQLLEEKQSWAQSMKAANNKLEALERLCRTLKSENDKMMKQNATSDPNEILTKVDGGGGADIEKSESLNVESNGEGVVNSE